MKKGSIGFSIFHENVGRFRSVLKTKPRKTETETERFSVGFSVGFAVKPRNWQKNETETERFSVGFSVGFSVKPGKKSTFQRI